MKNKLNISNGDVFCKLTIVAELPPYVLPSGQKNRKFKCKCECGNYTEVRLMHLTRGKIKSCGCLVGEKHNDSSSKLYNKWRAMMTRTAKYGIDSHRYHDRNITVCLEWKQSYLAFKRWALNNGYNDTLQLDRIDNSKGYYPENCRFVNQCQNLANRDNTVKVIYKGDEHVFMELLRSKNLESHEGAVRARIERGWDVNDAFDKPIRQGNYK